MKKHVWHVVFQEKQEREETSRPKKGIAGTCGSLIEETYVNWSNRLYGEGVLVHATEESLRRRSHGAQKLMPNYFSVLKCSGLGTKITTNII